MSLKVIAVRQTKGAQTGCHMLRIRFLNTPVKQRICESKEIGRKDFNKNFFSLYFFHWSHLEAHFLKRKADFVLSCCIYQMIKQNYQTMVTKFSDRIFWFWILKHSDARRHCYE